MCFCIQQAASVVTNSGLESSLELAEQQRRQYYISPVDEEAQSDTLLSFDAG